MGKAITFVVRLGFIQLVFALIITGLILAFIGRGIKAITTKPVVAKHQPL